MGTIGQALTAPDSGWRRYDDSDSRIQYSSNLTEYTTTNNSIYSNAYDGTVHACVANGGGTITFKFIGSELRIISDMSNGYSNSNSITIAIDGVNSTYTQYKSGTGTWQDLLFQQTGLTWGIHTINISASSSFSLDAIDIDATGYLVHPTLNQATSLSGMNIGDCIPCSYNAPTSGSVGSFFRLGTSIDNEISISGSATPNGLFYFIKVTKGKYIADRVIQTNISWDALNAAKYIQGALFEDVSLLHFDGNLTDSAGRIWIPQNGAATSLLQNKFGGSSLYLNGSSQCITTPKTSDFEFGSGDFTIDLWCYPTVSLPNQTYLLGSNRNGYYEGIAIYGIGTTLYGLVSTTGNSWLSPNISGLVLNVWNHVALIKYNGNLYIAINGTLSNPVTVSGSIITSLSTILSIGSTPASSCFFPGYIDEFHISKGIAKWTSNFTPPTSPYTLNSMKIRSLSGGNAYLTSTGTAGVTDASLGAYPVNNEWDIYITNSSLNGKITAGDNNIWNWNNIPGTYCQSTQILSIAASSSRVSRGPRYYSGVWYGSTVNYFNYGGSSGVGPHLGFRPVLEVPEDPRCTNIWY